MQSSTSWVTAEGLNGGSNVQGRQVPVRVRGPWSLETPQHGDGRTEVDRADTSRVRGCQAKHGGTSAES
jgi:hypothetical protein